LEIAGWTGARADSSYRLDLTVGAATTSGFRIVSGSGLVVAAADTFTVRVEGLYDPDAKSAFLELHNICNPPARVTAAHTGDELHSFVVIDSTDAGGGYYSYSWVLRRSR
jgi:hypothetical protein